MDNTENSALKNLFWKVLLITGVVVFIGVTFAVRAAQDVDRTFHGSGKLEFLLVPRRSGMAQSVTLQPDGMVVVAGVTDSAAASRNIGLARLTSQGELDKSFNGSGKKITDVGGVADGLGLAIDPATGKLIVAGRRCPGEAPPCAVAVLRYNPNGSLDSTFNGNGRRIGDFAGIDNGSLGAVALQPDGKIVVGGYVLNKDTGNYDFAVYRYLSGGALDPEFHGAGMVSIPFGSGRNDRAYGIALQPWDGHIVVAGETCDADQQNCNFAVARLGADGSLDRTFNRTGKQVTDLGASETAYGLALQPDGRIVLAGRKQASTASYFALTRYLPDGNLDQTFAGTGKKTFDFSGAGDNSANAVQVQASDGKIILCGTSHKDFALARLTDTGALDTGFHDHGKLTVDLGADDACHALAIQPSDGKYILAGWSDDGALKHWAVTRVLP